MIHNHKAAKGQRQRVMRKRARAYDLVYRTLTGIPIAGHNPDELTRRERKWFNRFWKLSRRYHGLPPAYEIHTTMSHAFAIANPQAQVKVYVTGPEDEIK